MLVDVVLYLVDLIKKKCLAQRLLRKLRLQERVALHELSYCDIRKGDLMRILHLCASAAILTSLACGAPAAHAGVIYSNNFSSDDDGFSGESTLITAPDNNQFVYFMGAGGSGTLTLGGLAADAPVSLTFDLYAVGSLDGYNYNGAGIPGNGNGDYFTVNSGSTQIFNQAFANYGNGEEQTYPASNSAPTSGSYAINGLGYSGFPQGSGNAQDAEYAFTLNSTANASGVASFTFFDNSNEGTSNEFYGIDNVSVSATTATSAVPEPTTWIMMLFGFGMVGFAMRYSRKQTVRVSYA